MQVLCEANRDERSETLSIITPAADLIFIRRFTPTDDVANHDRCSVSDNCSGATDCRMSHRLDLGWLRATVMATDGSRPRVPAKINVHPARCERRHFWQLDAPRNAACSRPAESQQRRLPRTGSLLCYRFLTRPVRLTAATADAQQTQQAHQAQHDRTRLRHQLDDLGERR